jgi:hypothetical protein
VTGSRSSIACTEARTKPSSRRSMSEYSWKFFSATAVSAQTPVSSSRSASWKAYTDRTRCRPGSAPALHRRRSAARTWRCGSPGRRSNPAREMAVGQRIGRQDRALPAQHFVDDRVRQPGLAGSSTVPSRRRAATGTGGSRSFWRSRMKARSASGNRSKMKFMIFSLSVSRSVTAPSAMLTWAIACSFSTDCSSSPRLAGARRRRGHGRGRVLGGVDAFPDHGRHAGGARRHQGTEQQLGRGQRQLVAVLERAPRAGQQALAVDEGAVRGMQVFDRPGGAAAAQAHVAAADRVQRNADELVRRQGVLALAADHDFVVQRKKLRPGRPVAEQLEIGADLRFHRHSSPCKARSHEFIRQRRGAHGSRRRSLFHGDRDLFGLHRWARR